MSPDLQADLTADLLRDLEVPGGVAGSPGGVASSPGPRRTPALSLTLTPLSWSWPGIRRVDVGTGLLVRLGPWRVELSV